jgi:hypothetical protein
LQKILKRNFPKTAGENEYGLNCMISIVMIFVNLYFSSLSTLMNKGCGKILETENLSIIKTISLEVKLSWLASLKEKLVLKTQPE